MTRSDGGTNASTRREDTVMSADDSEYAALPDDAAPEDPFEPEAPAHVDPDEETIVHDEDLDDEAVVDEVDPATDQPG
jgi:hypothetical protein